MENKILMVKKGKVMKYGNLIHNQIEDEKKGVGYIYSEHDKHILNKMCKEINSTLGVQIHYLAELDLFSIKNSGEIVKKYLNYFESESVKAYLIPQLVADKIENCAEIVYRMYLDFKASNDYIRLIGQPAPADIYVRYDNAFKRLKPKKLSNELIQLISNPRDAFYLPLTVRMVASWRNPKTEEVLHRYINKTEISSESVGMEDDPEMYCPPLSGIQKELLFSAIYGLRYYPTHQNVELLKKFINNENVDVSIAAKKSISAMT